MYKDTVIKDKLLRKGWFVTLLAILLLSFFFVVDFTGSFGKFLLPIFGPEETGLGVRFGVSVCLTMITMFFVIGISFFSFGWQIRSTWVLLGLLVLLFFLTFNLDFSFIQSKLLFMITQGVFTTLYVSAISIFFAFILALVSAIAKLSDNGLINGIATFYTSFFRGMPLLMQIYLIYLGLPQLGFIVDAVPAGITALTLCYGAYMTEIFRSGIISIPKGQWEASRSLGFNFTTTMRRVILPQAIPIIIPPTGNQFIALLKDSSLVSVIGVWELMFLAKTLGQSEFKHMEMLITAAVIYWALSMSLEYVQSHIENYYRRKK